VEGLPELGEVHLAAVGRVAATGVARAAGRAAGGWSDLEEEEGVVAPRVVGLEAAGGKAVDPEESVQKAAVGGLVAAVAVMEETT